MAFSPVVPSPSPFLLITVLLSLAFEGTCSAQESAPPATGPSPELAFTSALQRIRLAEPAEAAEAIVEALGEWRRVLPEEQRVALVKALRERLLRSVLVHEGLPVDRESTSTLLPEMVLRAHLLDGLIQHDRDGDGAEVAALYEVQDS